MPGDAPVYTAQEVRARLGISTFVLPEETSWPELMRRAAEAGIATLEILDRRSEFQEENPATMKQMLAAVREFGLSVTSFHSRSVDFGGLGLQEEIDRSKLMIDHLLELGGTV